MSGNFQCTNCFGKRATNSLYKKSKVTLCTLKLTQIFELYGPKVRKLKSADISKIIFLKLIGQLSEINQIHVTFPNVLASTI